MQNYPDERRKNTRIPLQLHAELHLPNNDIFSGQTENISFSGVYLTCVNSTNIPVGESGVFKIFLQAQPNPKIIEFKCRIVRIDENGSGIRFLNVDVKDYQQFKNLMVYNSPNPDKLLDELEQNPGIVIE